MNTPRPLVSSKVIVGGMVEQVRGNVTGANSIDADIMLDVFDGQHFGRRLFFET